MLKKIWRKPLTWGTIVVSTVLSAVVCYVYYAAVGLIPNPKEIGESLVDKVKEKVGKN